MFGGQTPAQGSSTRNLMPGQNPSGLGITLGGSGGGPAGGGPGGPNPAYAQNANALAGLMETLGKPDKNQPKPISFNSNVQTNPLQQKAFNAAQAASAGATNFANSLADRSNTSITNAMQRGRDTTAQALSDVRMGAGMRGGGPGSGLSGVLQTRAAMGGNRQNQALNASLTDVALGREGEARRGVTEAAGGMTGAAGAAAGNQAERERTMADVWKYGNTYQQNQAESNRRQQNWIIEQSLRSMQPWSGA